MESNRNTLGQIVPSDGLTQGGELSGVLNQLFYLGLAAAAVLAVAMIVRGGIQYMASSDSSDGKGRAKRRIQAAVGGLVLAFASVLLLQTINPSLTKLNLQFRPIQLEQADGAELGIEATPNEVREQIVNSVAQYNGITPEVVDEMLRTGQIPQGLTPAAQKILAEAMNAVGNMKSGAIPGTDGGNVACAAVVNMIIQRATGEPINSSLSTINMKASLDKSDRFVLVGSDVNQALPGDIIISPTQSGNTGHVGIVTTAGGTQIISNSSRYAEVRQNFTGDSWTNYYGNKKGLGVYIYRPK